MMVLKDERPGYDGQAFQITELTLTAGQPDEFQRPPVYQASTRQSSLSTLRPSHAEVRASASLAGPRKGTSQRDLDGLDPKTHGECAGDTYPGAPGVRALSSHLVGERLRDAFFLGPNTADERKKVSRRV